MAQGGLSESNDMSSHSCPSEWCLSTPLDRFQRDAGGTLQSNKEEAALGRCQWHLVKGVLEVRHHEFQDVWQVNVRVFGDGC